MANENALKVIQKVQIPFGTDVLQLGDGTIVYFTRQMPRKLYVKKGGREIAAVLPAGTLYITGAHENSVYVQTSSLIYRCSFTLQNNFDVSLFRDILKDEVFWFDGFSTVVRNGNKHCFRVWDENNRIIVDREEREKWIEATGRLINRKKLILLTKNDRVTEPSARMHNDNIISVEVSFDSRYQYAPSDSSPFVYFLCKEEKLHVLNTESLTFRQPLIIEGHCGILKITGVNNGIITFVEEDEMAKYIISAQLPEGYYHCTHKKPPVSKEKELNVRTEEAIGQISDLDSDLESISYQCCCAICNETYDSDEFIPRVLDCGHSFCEVCIYKIIIDKRVNCPTCSKISDLPDGKVLPVIYALISIAEQTMNRKVEPIVACKECGLKFSSRSVRMCMQNDCGMFNQLICLSCVVDGGHMGHRVVKYDVKMEQVELRSEIKGTCAEIDEKKTSVRQKSNELTAMLKTINENLTETNIPQHFIDKVNTLTSEQDVGEYREMLNDLASPLKSSCDTLSASLDACIDAAREMSVYERT